jgi:hypothetical protein
MFIKSAICRNNERRKDWESHGFSMLVEKAAWFLWFLIFSESMEALFDYERKTKKHQKRHAENCAGRHPLQSHSKH